MEDEDDVEGVELLARDGKSKSDKDGMKDDAELEDEDCRHLSGVVFDVLPIMRVIFCVVVVVDVMAIMT